MGKSVERFSLVYSELMPDNDGDYVYAADYDRKAAELADAIKYAQEWRSTLQTFSTEVYELSQRVKELEAERAEWFDKQHGTPCEQIRHEQQIEALQAEIDSLKQARKCVHIFGADGDGSSCYCCGAPNPARGRSGEQ